MTFSGRYDAKLDDKGRIVIPAPIRSLMEEADDNRIVLSKSICGDCIEMSMYAEWERKKDDLVSRLDMFNPEHKLILRAFMQGSTIITADNKLGRITIPKLLMDSVGIIKDVIFSGVEEYIEIWSGERFTDISGQFSTLVKQVPKSI